MSLVKPTVYDGSIQRQMNIGDIFGMAESIPATLTSNAVTVTGAMLASDFIQSTETGAAAYTLDSAANILAAITSLLAGNAIQNGTTWRIRHINNAAFAVTYGVTANTGMSVTNGVVNASSVKDFLVTIVNGTPAAVVSALTTNASAVLSGFSSADIAKLSVGMIVTNAVAGLQGTTIIGINLTAGTVTMSGNANATNATPVAINFSPVISVTGIGQGLL